MTILIASTIAPYKCVLGQDTAWLRNAEFIEEEANDAGHDVEWFVSIERDARGDAPFADLIWRMEQLNGTVWRYSVDDGADAYTSENRLYRICMGRNLAIEHAMRRRDVTDIMWLDTDIMIPNDSVGKLKELDRDLKGGVVTVVRSAQGSALFALYNREGPPVMCARDGNGVWESETRTTEGDVDVRVHAERPFPEGADVRAHWTTAGFLMVSREAFRRVTWHYDLDEGLTDDPAFQREASALFGQTWVRHDLIGQHADVPMVAIEERPHHDLAIRKEVAA